MNRSDFIKYTLTTAGAMSLTTLNTLAESLSEQDVKMPVLFIGHGSPMNAIEENEFTRGWQAVAKQIQRPKAILFVSAHWLTRGTFVTGMQHPETIHDFGGFPQELFAAQYPAPGNPELAKEVAGLFTATKVEIDEKWGLDHGAWSVAKPMYPEANIPTLQLSIDYYKPAAYHYELAKSLAALRKKGVLIIGSGNMVHNLRLPNFSMPGQGFDWAIEMNEVFKKHILDGNHQPLLDYEKLGSAAKLAIPTPDHYYPMLYTLGLQDKDDKVSIFNDKATYGSLTMTSVRIG
jgi:4,5-DOPA dioxygenase extradiol